MKLIDVSTMRGRANGIMLLWEDVPILEPTGPANRAIERVREACKELQAGLDLYAEANPLTIAPGLVKRRAKKPRRRGRKSGK